MAGALPAIHDTGEGAPLLLLHAFPLDASQWDHQVAALSGRYRCLRPDYWGCGSSVPPHGEASLDAYAAAVVRALDALEIDRFHLVGASMGGYVAFGLLRLAPERVLSLVLANTRATADNDEVRTARLSLADTVEREESVESIVEPNVQRLLGEHGRHEVHVTDPMRGRIRRCTPAGVAHCARAMAARPDSTSMLSAISAPTLVIAGRADEVVPRADIDALAAAIPGARMVTLGCGHLCNLEYPPLFTEETRRFLESVPLVAA
ncbi:MAG: alpha/beta fold hydrolase [Candidatus Dormibacteraeota bacterium]|nr:alpha/beta fold hydrolase [Candidatus Dormibacteraeota bacterium]